ncbi:response regulator [Motilimonas pumila]|uniref:Two-component system response regulator n=1 Tax=Motilimonas pumila TaxID=2303987 RepID=A0A418YEP4_9GAMM|nr:two-component system response regulator [Motilimonas pumila]RJG47622.1 two-component system response regulator [Motilimonas pumila]
MDKSTILVVDDTAQNIDVLSGILKKKYKVKAALSGEKALKIAQTSPPDMILLDIMMPNMDGYEVCRKLKQDPLTASIPVIFVTAKNETDDESKGLALGAVDFMSKPVRPAIVEARVATHLALYDQNKHLENTVKRRTEELEQTQFEIIKRLGRAAEYKDNETGLHVIRMSHYAKLIAEQLALDPTWVDLVFKASPMHDIGKIGIPDSILQKPGKLTEEEWHTMRKHTHFGATILGEHSSALMRLASEIALSHHEKWDGSGYPYGLAGTDIPLSGRVVAVADVFDALTSVRPYKEAWPMERAIAFINENSGSHFDPEIVTAFIAVLPQVEVIKQQYADEIVPPLN